jgi:hypothetical protein
MTHTDFDGSLKNLNSYEQGGSGGGYTVRGGDTLSGIAANLWGDAGLWYKLAEANGLSQQSGLTEGQRLTIPSGVTKNTHNASTFKPYDPADAIGETSPTNPAPSKAAKKNKCGMFGAILLVAVAVAVTVVTAGAALAATGAVAGGPQLGWHWRRHRGVHGRRRRGIGRRGRADRGGRRRRHRRLHR